MPVRARQLVGDPADRLRTTVFSSRLGWVATAWRGTRLAALTFGHRTPQQAGQALGLAFPADLATACAAAADDALTQRLQDYANGHPDDFLDVPVALDDHTEFQRRVLQRCRRIRFGHTLTYGALAAAVGRPGAARAVGQVMARNPIPLVIPCHRVVGSHGTLGGFSAPDGVRMKQRLLALERGCAG